MLSKTEVLEYQTIESQAVRYIDSQLLMLNHRAYLEFSVDHIPQDVLDKLRREYELKGWEITQENQKSFFTKGGNGPDGTERHWLVQ